jgi:glycolate oxidase FAD binding subunit
MGQARSSARAAAFLKNVTGLDLCKFLAGSRGTLAVLTEVTAEGSARPRGDGKRSCSAALMPLRGVSALAAGLGSPFGVTRRSLFACRGGRKGAPALGAGGSATILRVEEFC